MENNAFKQRTDKGEILANRIIDFLDKYKISYSKTGYEYYSRHNIGNSKINNLNDPSSKDIRYKADFYVYKDLSDFEVLANTDKTMSLILKFVAIFLRKQLKRKRNVTKTEVK